MPHRTFAYTPPNRAAALSELKTALSNEAPSRGLSAPHALTETSLLGAHWMFMACEKASKLWKREDDGPVFEWDCHTPVGKYLDQFVFCESAPASREEAVRELATIIATTADAQHMTCLRDSREITEETILYDDTLAEAAKSAARSWFPDKAAEIDRYHKSESLTHLLDRCGLEEHAPA